MELYATPDGIFSQLEKLPSTTTPDLNKNIGGSTDLARKYQRSADLHIHIPPPPITTTSSLS